MIPKEKVQEIIAKHNSIEKELSSGNLDPKLYAKKSKEYSDLKNIIKFAEEYMNFDKKERDLYQIIQDKKNDSEIIEMAEKEVEEQPFCKLETNLRYILFDLEIALL